MQILQGCVPFWCMWLQDCLPEAVIPRISQLPPSFGVHTFGHYVPVTSSPGWYFLTTPFDTWYYQEFVRLSSYLNRETFIPSITLRSLFHTPRFTLILRQSQHQKWQNSSLYLLLEYFQWLSFQTKVVWMYAQFLKSNSSTRFVKQYVQLLSNIFFCKKC